MAEELRIVVSIEGGSGNGNGTNKGDGAVMSAIPRSANNKINSQTLSETVSNKYYGRKEEIISLHSTSTPKGFLRRETMTSNIKFDDNTGATVTQIGTSKIQDWANSPQAQRTARIARTTAIAAGREVVDIMVSNAKYTSGDSYANARLDNTMKLANYATSMGVGAAVAGPFGVAAMAAAIVVNETGSAIRGAHNYGYDRRFEGMTISAAKAVAGNLTYGRPRGE